MARTCIITQTTLVLALPGANVACQSISLDPPRQSSGGGLARVASAEPEPSSRPAADAGTNNTLAKRRFAPSPETLDEIAKIRGTNWQLFPQTYPPSRLAFFARSLAFISDHAIRAVPVMADRGSNPCRSNQLTVEGPREIVTLADQTLLVLGRSTSFVLDSNCQTTRVLPRVSYLPGYHVLPEPRWANAFSLFDPPSGRFFRFRWDPNDTKPSAVFLPTAEIEESSFRNAVCSLMRDGSFACLQGQQLVASWPGHRARALGSIEPGAPVVRLLPAERVDHVRVLRENAALEEYWLIPGTPKASSFTLPNIPFDMAIGPAYLAVLQLNPSSERHVTESTLVVLEADGKLRWSVPRESVPQNLSERDWIHHYFDCINIAAHPVRPFLAVSTCERIDVYDSRTGEVVQRVERSAQRPGTPSRASPF